MRRRRRCLHRHSSSSSSRQQAQQRMTRWHQMPAGQAPRRLCRRHPCQDRRQQQPQPQACHLCHPARRPGLQQARQRSQQRRPPPLPSASAAAAVRRQQQRSRQWGALRWEGASRWAARRLPWQRRAACLASRTARRRAERAACKQAPRQLRCGSAAGRLRSCLTRVQRRCCAPRLRACSASLLCIPSFTALQAEHK